MCPVCPDCSAPPTKINPDCKKCVRCENVEGYMRDRDPFSGKSVEQVIKIIEPPENVSNKAQHEEPKMPLLHIDQIKRR